MASVSLIVIVSSSGASGPEKKHSLTKVSQKNPLQSEAALLLEVMVKSALHYNNENFTMKRDF